MTYGKALTSNWEILLKKFLEHDYHRLYLHIFNWKKLNKNNLYYILELKSWIENSIINQTTILEIQFTTVCALLLEQIKCLTRQSKLWEEFQNFAAD